MHILRRFAHDLVLYMQSGLLFSDLHAKVSILCSALYAECPYYVVLYMKSALYAYRVSSEYAM